MSETAHLIVWNRLQGELLSFVTNRVKDKSLAEDIVQDVFVKVHSKAGQLRESEKITSWIYQITRHAIADHFRKASRSPDPAAIDWDSDYHEFNACVAGCLKDIMHSLPEKYRIPLELAEMEDLSQYELAERLNITYSGARSRVQRARRMLREKFDALYRVETDAYGNVMVCEDRVPCGCRNSDELLRQ
jgi:RNA polymerase sigma-70 factor (ECF subfamily)